MNLWLVNTGSWNRYFLTCLFFLIILVGNAQVFPLKVSSEGPYLISRNKNPFLVNAASIELGSTDHIIQSLSRFNYQGVNTVLVSCQAKVVEFTKKGRPQKSLKRVISSIKRIVQEAALMNMSVIILPYDSIIHLKDDVKLPYLSLLFKKFNRHKNVMWLLNETDIKNTYLLNQINPKQLKGLNNSHLDSVGSVSDFLTISDPGLLNTSYGKPTLLQINTNKTIPDSIAHAIRLKAYTGFLKGACGFIVNYADKDNGHSIDIQYQFKLAKDIFESLPWHQLHTYPEILSVSKDSLRGLAEAAIHNDSSLIAMYLSSGFTLPLNLAIFDFGVKIKWINAKTGEAFYSQASSVPVQQLFLPPITGEKNSDWIVILKPIGTVKLNKSD